MSAQLPVLFFPGTLCDERIFMPLWQKLSLHQRRYVPLQWAASKEDMLALSKDRILENEKVHLVAFSMGGYIAALLLQLKPENIASITLIGYNPEGLSDDELRNRQQLITLLKSGTFKPDNDAYLARFIHPSRLNDDTVTSVVKDMAQDLGKNTLLNHTLATTPRESTVSILAQSKAPVHFIAACEDNIAPASAIKQCLHHIPGATIDEIAHAGHMLPLEQCDKIAAMLAKRLG